MFNGIKPTRLWHLTSRKYFNRMILDRQEVLGRTWDQRDRFYLLQFLAIHFGVATAVLMSLDWFRKPVCPAKLGGTCGEELANHDGDLKNIEKCSDLVKQSAEKGKK